MRAGKGGWVLTLVFGAAVVGLGVWFIDIGSGRWNVITIAGVCLCLQGGLLFAYAVSKAVLSRDPR
ncbi:MAG: hypothetical protein ACE5F9_08850 [Phycisphaerae bacterium]